MRMRRMKRQGISVLDVGVLFSIHGNIYDNDMMYGCMML